MNLPLNASERAVAEQREASDPTVSAFVAASAGSGKTKLLTDRMLRLMLGGAKPDRIQCLTFTKAAAAEMSLRLQRRLGRWATIPDDDLDAELVELLVPPTPDKRQEARALFADVLDLPGGMRIGTIHAFCQSLLRRFPLEAAISPHFQLVEDGDARLAMNGAREDVLAHADPDALRELAGLVNADAFGRLVMTLQGQRGRLDAALDLAEPRLASAMRRALGVGVATDAELLAAAVSWPDADTVRAVLRLSEAHGSPGVQDTARRMLGWLGLPAELRAEHWDEWLRELLRGDGAPRALSAYAAKRLAEQHPDIHRLIGQEQERVLAVEDNRRALRVANASLGLLRVAGPVLQAYDRRKGDAGLLDYSDRIGRTSQVLINPGAAWVLYKLDGGIDHLLLDEVQDTAPEQWQIAHRLTEEFFAGLGTRTLDDGPARTFFAVGDPKQSIYSFQGADPEEFDRSRTQMAKRVGGSGMVWRDVALDVSFRSTPAVLALVDAVFSDPVAAQGVAEDGLRHYPNRAGTAGRVELWPLTPMPEDTPHEPWTVPERNQTVQSAMQRLADALADHIASELQDGVLLPARGRPMVAGDILVLVRRRNEFAGALVRALKSRGVAVAGLDRMELTEQAAVQDLLAACDAVLLPQDDLAVACVLTSPLGGLTDDSLMRLAMGRTGRLWDALRERHGEREAWRQAWVFLLSAALMYTATHAPSLQGFVLWLRRSGATVKREAEGAGGAVRVMTVHGAKGLQAPMVIVPDTTSLPPDEEPFAWVEDAPTGACLPLWSPRRELRCQAVDAARAAERARRAREYNRLLDVALTRAEDRLLVCGWQNRREASDTSWYAMVARGFHVLDAEATPFSGVPGAWDGDRLVHKSAQTAAVPDASRRVMAQAATLPPWAGRPGAWTPDPPPLEPALPVPLAPSRPDGAAYGPVPHAASPLSDTDRGQGFLRGRLVHTLLQHLPDVRPADRALSARRHLAQTGFGLDAAEVDALLVQTLAVLDHPELQPVFGAGSRAEQPLTGLVSGTVVTGVVDRMAVLPDRVWLVDYKTLQDPPADVADTPVRYLRQLAAYRAVLAGIYPDRPVTCALVWTQAAAVVVVPGTLLDAHQPRA